MRNDLVEALTAASNAPGTALAQAALVIARIEYPRLDPEPYLAHARRAWATRRAASSQQHAESSGEHVDARVRAARSTATCSTSSGSRAIASNTRTRATAA